MMATFVDSHVQALLTQAEARLDGSASLPKQKKSTSSSLAALRAEQQASSSAPPTPASQIKAVRAPESEAKAQGLVKDTAGLSWFNLPKTDMTPEFKRDWQLLRMRGVLDPKHYKKALRSGPPKYSQVGEIIEGAAESRNARLSRRERKGTILEHMMAEQNRSKLKSKYADIQQVKTSGKKAFYRKLVSERRKGRG